MLDRLSSRSVQRFVWMECHMNGIYICYRYYDGGERRLTSWFLPSSCDGPPVSPWSIPLKLPIMFLCLFGPSETTLRCSSGKCPTSKATTAAWSSLPGSSFIIFLISFSLILWAGPRVCPSFSFFSSEFLFSWVHFATWLIRFAHRVCAERSSGISSSMA